jgi:hypothetical protein
LALLFLALAATSPAIALLLLALAVCRVANAVTPFVTAATAPKIQAAVVFETSTGELTLA